ncbi:hypothetical protein C0J52_09519 [Blattella germanica]|nr:hypothetical protein C0J52_09519 [Blattella germanica]
MLQQFLQPQLQEDDILATGFQTGWSPSSFSQIVWGYLDVTFLCQWNGRGSIRIWAPRSPNMTPLDFYTWG